MYFIDTHIAVWLYQMSLDLLSEKVINAIDNNDIFISPIISLELEYLFEIGKIKENSQNIVEYLSNKIGLEVDENSFSDVISTAINEKWTRDPFDRIIVAHAKQRDSYLITRDKLIIKNYYKSVF